MGKLVLFLVDGTTLDVPLDRERITIGRRADNDVCLPFPAVSGEHAAVVTILADSFLEDLGSTNGTLINGKPAQKHFLRDHDQIDIGRQRITYLSDNDATVEPLPADMLRQQIRGLTELVTPARLASKVVLGTAPRTAVGGAGAPLLADLERHMGEGGVTPGEVAPAAPPSAGSAERPPAAPGRAERRRERAGAIVTTEGATAPAAEPAATPAPAATASAGPAVPVVRVLSGASLGRSMAMHKDELSVGRVGVQVALLRRESGGFRLIPVEGGLPPRINGAAVPVEGAPLHPGDTFEVAGVRLELSLPA